VGFISVRFEVRTAVSIFKRCDVVQADKRLPTAFIFRVEEVEEKKSDSGTTVP
jgi:hypothetical protein